GLQVGQGEQKTKGISECERKIKKIKTMRGEIALANGVFQQPVIGNKISLHSVKILLRNFQVVLRTVPLVI
ncbi:hypothetical protein B9Z45_16530, partial [Limnohabitans sp. 2KL-17]|uniref:hypothetical protein n=1 Tax=Limnohabitans sp. 2KL-17 TaxID=1100704 RepID=UPI000DD27D99